VSAGLAVAVVVLALVVGARPAMGADYRGPLIDAHSHLPNPAAIEAYVAAMKRHDVTRVVLLGVGAVQKDDAAWIGSALRKHGERVVAGLPLPDPMSAAAASRLDAEAAKGVARAIGEVHIRQVSRKIERDPADPAFIRVLEVAARHRLPVVIHAELDEPTTSGLERALRAVSTATIVLAHGGGGPPDRLGRLLQTHRNLMVDLSGMHFERTPALATEAGPLDLAWKALIEAHPDRFVMGIDVWAPRLLEPSMLDRLMRWTRRVLGELEPGVAMRVAHGNATALFRMK